MQELIDAFFHADNRDDWTEALHIARQAIAAHPQDAQAYAMRARAQMKLGNDDDADRDVDAALKLNPDNALAIATQAARLSEDGQSKEAIKRLDAAISRLPANAHLHIARGWERREMGQLDAALEDFKRAAMLEPDNMRGAVNAAAIAGELGRKDEAAAMWAHLGKTQPDNGMLAYNAGTSLYQMEEYEAAIDHLDRARRLLGPVNAVQMNRALALQRLDRHQDAIDEWENLLQREPTWDWVLSGLGRSYYRLGNLQKSAEYFRRIDTDNGNLEGTEELGWLLFDDRRSDDLIKLAKPHATQPGASVDFMRMMGMAHRWSGHKDEAREWMEQTVAAHDGNAPARGDLALQLHSEFGEFEEALKHIQVALALNPDSVRYRDIYNDINAGMGKQKSGGGGWLKRLFGGR